MPQMIDLDELEKRTESGAGGYVVPTHQLLDLLQLARIGRVIKDIRRDEWEYIIKTFEHGSDRQWAIGSTLRAILPLLKGDADATHE